MKEIREIITAYEGRREEAFAFATLVRARGSSYRRPGARMLIAADGKFAGTLSGGCLEEEVVARAREIIASGAAKLLHVDTRLRYGCNGAIDIFVEKVKPQVLQAISDAQRRRADCVIATVFERSDSLGSRILDRAEKAPPGVFVQTIHPPVQLLLVGEGPDSPALRAFTAALGWDLIEAEDVSTLPNEFDEWTAALVKTHNYGRDFAALQKLLPLGLRYLALLGPRMRRDQLLHTLMEEGVAMRSELFAPAGLDIGAEGPEQIALAIVTEIQCVFAGAPVDSLRERKAPIHLATDLAVA